MDIADFTPESELEFLFYHVGGRAKFWSALKTTQKEPLPEWQTQNDSSKYPKTWKIDQILKFWFFLWKVNFENLDATNRTANKENW